jgi:hypothetical protein
MTAVPLPRHAEQALPVIAAQMDAQSANRRTCRSAGLILLLTHVAIVYDTSR